MPLKFCDEAFAIVVHLINFLPSKVIENETPHTHLLKQQQDYTFICVFGYACWPNLRPYDTKKLQFSSKRCMFLWYSNHRKGYKCLDPSNGRIYISLDVVFDEEVFPFHSMHPNAGARLRTELSLLLESPLN
jgi:hypothetical protein